MRLGYITLVIVLMVLALNGLIGIQIYWISKALAVNNETFARQVNSILQDVSARLERKDAFTFISTHSLQDTAILPDVGIKSLSPEVLRPYLLNDLQRLRVSKSFLPDADELANQGSMPAPEKDAMPSLAEKIVEDNIGPELQAEDINKVLKKKYLLQKLATDLYRRATPLADRVDYALMDTLLHKELLAAGINIPYTYGIYNDNNHEVLYVNSSHQGIKADTAAVGRLISSPYQARLFPNDFFLTANYLKLHFTGRNLFLVKRIGGVMASSILFILIIFFSFLWMIRSFLEQKKLSEMKSDFINNMTHEFKTPITTISLASEALKDNDVQKDAGRLERLATVISEENKRLEAQVERVLQMAKLERGEFKLNLVRVDVHDTIEHAVDNVSLLLKERGGSLKTNLQATRPVLLADKVHLTNIIYNLLDNAIKYSHGPVDVEVRTINREDKIIVEVSDKGIGMTQEQQKRVFEQFYRVPTGNVHNVKGFGLGLSYVKTMSEAHGGEVTLISTAGKGSTFTVWLPMRDTAALA